MAFAAGAGGGAKKVSVKVSGVAGAIAFSGKAKKPTTRRTTAAAPAASTAAPVQQTADPNNLLEWNGIKFFCNASKIVAFNDLNINASCETEDTEDNGDKYVSLKNRKGFEVTFTAYFDARLGIADVRADALALAGLAASGGQGYIYCKGTKLVSPNMMATSGKISKVQIAPNGKWISCEIKMTLKSCGRMDGSIAVAAAAATNRSNGKNTTKNAIKGTIAAASATIAAAQQQLAKKLSLGVIVRNDQVKSKKGG